MKEFEKMYTVEDIAQITSMTSRTIRNYLKDGTLRGRKIGGQWRFTMKDIKRLFNAGSFASDSSKQRRQEIIDFVDGVKTDMQGTVQICTIADCYCENQQAGHELYEKLVKVINEKGDGSPAARFDYEFIEAESKVRFTLFGAPGFIIETLQRL